MSYNTDLPTLEDLSWQIQAKLRYCGRRHIDRERVVIYMTVELYHSIAKDLKGEVSHAEMDLVQNYTLHGFRIYLVHPSYMNNHPHFKIVEEL